MQGSLEALRELWTGEEVEEPTTLDSMSQIWVRPEEMTNIMEMNMKKAQRRHKYYYDQKAKESTLEVGDEVLVMIPSKKSKLNEGLYRIIK